MLEETASTKIEPYPAVLYSFKSIVEVALVKDHLKDGGTTEEVNTLLPVFIKVVVKPILDHRYGGNSYRKICFFCNGYYI